MLPMDKIYDHLKHEKIIYDKWQEIDAFSPEGTLKLRNSYGLKSIGKSYSILMPPPNANAPLHCGHVTYSIQDLMIRYKRMCGYDALYLPGTDHAGFETQYVYERNLQKEGKNRFDFDRETFYSNVLNFVKENSGIAISQLKRLGMSADWSKLTFTLDPKAISTVYETFIKLHSEGLVYRSGYMVNFSTFYGTTFSDLETEYKDSVTPLYYVKYPLVAEEVFITVATVRPETIYADVAIAVNPKDKRYQNFVGKKALNPLTKKEMPIITDDYVDIEFGTGALKITPGHDINDYKIGQKYGLETISLINLDGKMNEKSIGCEGLFPKQARVKSVEILQGLGAIEKIDEKYQNRVLVDYKEGYPIEPMILPNWFIDMSKLSDLAIEAVEKNEVKFNLLMWKKEILRWIKEKKPWPISRQTVFGIRIPVWYPIDENPKMQVTFISFSKELVKGEIAGLLEKYSLEEIKLGIQKVLAPNDAEYIVSVESPGENYIPETDTFDTWFSSGQWPLTTTHYPDGDIHKKYFPTDLLDSAYEIMFFWIARMIVFSKYLTNKVPFKMVYFHGIVTDKFGKKMSKSKGNVVNPIEMTDKYGADALRMGIVVGGNTEAKFSPFDENQVRGYRNFANKIWNVARFIKMKEEELEANTSRKDLLPEDQKIIEQVNELVIQVTKDLDRLKFKLAGDAIYHFIWDELASNYLEQIKDRKDKASLVTLKYCFLTSIKLLHPFMPFVTETVWKELNDEDCPPLIITPWP